MNPRDNSALVIGTVGIDHIETPVETREHVLGGSAWFGALAASLYAPAHIVAAVGYDFTKADLAILHARQIETTGLHFSETLPTFAWSARYGEGFLTRETTGLHLNALEEFQPVVSPQARKACFAMLCNFEPRLQRQALIQLDHDTFVMLDTIDYWIKEKRREVLALIPRCGLLLLNDEEAALLTGHTDIHQAGKALLEAGAGAAIIKRGSLGSLLVHPDGEHPLGVCTATRLVDPTGAGDTFAGAILGYLASQGRTDFTTLCEAMRRGAAAASFTVEAFSAQALLDASPQDIEARMATLT